MTERSDAPSVSDRPDVDYPAAPWQMRWDSSGCRCSGCGEDVDERRTAGVYGAAFVSYEPGSDLTYSELLVARPVKTDEHGRRVEITDIWVDSPASVAGGRELWAIPKGLCDFTLETGHTGPLSRTAWSASLDRRPIASASVHRRLEGGAAAAVQGRHLAAGDRRHRRRGAHRHPAGLLEDAALPRPLGVRTRTGRSAGWPVRGSSRRSGWRASGWLRLSRVRRSSPGAAAVGGRTNVPG